VGSGETDRPELSEPSMTGEALVEYLSNKYRRSEERSNAS